MSKFCENCNNLLLEKYMDNSLAFSCESCHTIYNSDPSDSLRKSRVKGIEIISTKILDRAIDDPVALKAYVKCIKKNCKGVLVKQVRINDATARLYNICTTCHVQWLYQIDD